MDALAELSAMRKRGTRPEGPVVLTHSQQIAAYFREPNRGFYVAMLGHTELWNALAGLDVMLIDWKREPRHVEDAQSIVGVGPSRFLTSLWENEANGGMRKAKTTSVAA